MKLLTLTTSYPSGPSDPSGRFVMELDDVLSQRGFDVRTVCLASPPGGALAAFERGESARLGAAVLRMLREAHRGPVDAVLAHWLVPSAIVGASLGVPLVGVAHGGDLRVLDRFPRLRRFVSRRLDGVICVSRRGAETLGVERCLVTPMGASDPWLSAPPLGPQRLLFMGRLVPVKGVDTLLRAAGELPLTIAGDGPERSRLEALAGPNTRFIGAYRPADRAGLLSTHHVLCVPSLPGEGTPRVVMEALCAGRPVLASDVGGLRDVLPADWLLPPGDVSAWGDRLRQISIQPLAAPTAQMRRAASWDSVGPRIAGFLSAVITGVDEGPLVHCPSY